LARGRPVREMRMLLGILGGILLLALYLTGAIIELVQF
jgi:hypothetical protein